MKYTLTNNDLEVEIIAFVLNIFDHKVYNKIHKYKYSFFTNHNIHYNLDNSRRKTSNYLFIYNF